MTSPSTRTQTDPSILAVKGRFNRYGPEEEVASRKTDVKETKVPQQLIEAWKRFRFHYDTGFVRGRGVGGANMKALELVETLVYSAEDVRNFCLKLAEFQDENMICEKSGVFLSALINSGVDERYSIITSHLAAKPWFLGYRNTKTVIIEGDCGLGVGAQMKGGFIEVRGSVEDRLGAEMEGGKIIVKGDCGDEIGGICHFQNKPMSGGEIHIEGNIGNLYWDWGGRKTIGGKIYHKGRLIFEK
jgi:hypothetical protein